MSRQTVTTTVREFDEEGRCVKETVTTSEYDWTQGQVYPTYPSYPYPNPNYPYWRPQVTHGGTAQGQWTTTNVPPTPQTNFYLRAIQTDEDGDGSSAGVAS